MLAHARLPQAMLDKFNFFLPIVKGELPGVLSPHAQFTPHPHLNHVCSTPGVIIPAYYSLCTTSSYRLPLAPLAAHSASFEASA
eukprot:1998129-Pleurochrysis_carterae.AAC.1